MNTTHFGFGDQYFPTGAGKFSPARHTLNYQMSRKAKFSKDPKRKLLALKYLSICLSKLGCTVLITFWSVVFVLSIKQHLNVFSFTCNVEI